jgi:glutaryl-CoA dehydrogenase
VTTSASTHPEALFQGLGEARSTDYFFQQEQLTDEQLSALRRGFQIVRDRLVRMLAEVTAMQPYCLQIGRLAQRGQLSDTIAGLAKLNNTRKARQVCARPGTCWAATGSCSRTT